MNVFGDQVLTFVVITDGALDRNGIATQVRTEVVSTGWHFRPYKTDEMIALTDLATELWKGTGPPEPEVLAAKAIDEVKHEGITYQISGGVQPYRDFSDQVHKVTIYCTKQTG